MTWTYEDAELPLYSTDLYLKTIKNSCSLALSGFTKLLSSRAQVNAIVVLPAECCNV